jgi:ubiquinone biosynthesis protein UbiJ
MGFLNCKFISKEDFYLTGFHCLALVVQPLSHLLLIVLADDIIHLLFQFKTKGGSQLKEYCSALTKEDCRRQCGSFIACEKVSKYIVLLLFPT